MRHPFSLFLVVASAFSAELPAGRSTGETPVAIAPGPAGSVYITGSARGYGDRNNIYVTRIEARGDRRTFTTYLGEHGEQVVKAIAVDRIGNAYVVGQTASAGTRSADVFVSQLDPKGNWVYSTSFGGSADDSPQAVAVDSQGELFVTGWTRSSDFPALGEIGGQLNAFVVKMRAGEKLDSRIVNAGGLTSGAGIAVDSDGAVYVAGSVERSNRSDAFLIKLNKLGDQVYRNILSGSGDQHATSVAISAAGVAWLGGWTSSSDFPSHRGDYGGGRDAFLARFDPDGNHTFSKLIGSKADEEAHEVALDSKGNVYLAGTVSGEERSFAIKLSPDGERVFLKEPVGAAIPGHRIRMAVDALGNAVTAGTAVRRLATCRYRISKAIHTFDLSGGEDSVLMDAPAECGWTPESYAPWITVTRHTDGFEFRAAPNYGAPRAGTVIAGGQTLMILQNGKGDLTRAAITGAIRANSGFQTSTLGACDDSCSSPAVPLGFSINFFGTTYSTIFVNNNGNVTFGSSNTGYTASPISGVSRVLIAPFWADVDTTGTGSGVTRYGTDIINGRKAFGVNWVDVGYYSSKTDKLNSFQLLLIERGDLGVGFFDIELNYASVQWETGSANGGTNGIGGNPARAGFSNGTGTAGTFFELPGSGISGALLNGGSNSLAANSTNSGGVAGRYVYNVRAGSIVCGTGITATAASVATGGGPVNVNVNASNSACTWNITGLPAWITVSLPAGGNGTGSAGVTLQVAANSGAARSATISIAGQTFTVNQAGSAAPSTCPPVSFLRGADLSLLGGNLTQGTLAGLERLLDGSMTLHTFTGNTSNYTQSSTPQYQQSLTNCIGRPPVTPTTPQNYQLLSEQRGTPSINPMVTNLMNNGQSSSVGVGAYSLNSAKLQVWNATANKTPGTRSDYDIPANPQKLLSADFNNDNKRDVGLISQGPTGGTQGVFSTLTGNGDGTLGQRRDVNVGNNPQSATTAHFNSDNRLDVAVANTGSNNVMILMGNGDMTFQPPVTLAGDAPGPRSIGTADFNKDGRQDLMIGHNDGVDVRLGNGNGTFQAPNRIARGFIANTVGSGDFNKDGNPDIAVSSETSASAMIIHGNGNGTFQSPNAYVTRDNAGPFFVTDFDFDGNSDIVFGGGHPDAITPAAGDSNLTVLYGRSNGTLHGAPSVVLPSLGGFTASDFNGDNVPDVIATAPFVNSASSVLDRAPTAKAPVADTLPNTGGLNLSLNNGSGTLLSQTPIPVPPGAPAQLFHITSGDFNGDGRRDVAVSSGTTVHVLTGNGFGGFNPPASFTAGPSITSINAADINGDTRQDLVITDDTEDRVSVALGNGNATFQGRTIINHNNLDPKGTAIADVNGDGRPDLIVINFGTAGSDVFIGGISILINAGNGAFQAATNIASGSHPTNVTVGDVNLDGKPDIITSTGGAGGATLVAVHLGNGNGTFQTPTLIPVAFGPAQTALTDFNADGKVDIIVGHCCGEVQMGVLLGNGNGTFQPETSVPNTGNGSSFVVVTDMNKDTKPDIVFGANGPNGGYVATLLNTTSATAPVCSFGVSQASYQVGTQAQTLAGTLTSSATTCSFNAESSASWLSVTPTFGQGQTAYPFNIAVQPNVGALRTGTVTIGGRAVTVTQAGPNCPFNLTPTTLSPPPAGGAFTIGVATNGGCPWSITGVPAWITIQSPASLNSAGNGTINLQVAANAGVARIANLTIGGQAFRITQAGTGPAGGLRFTAIEPCRVMETRAEYNFEGRTGQFGPPALNANETRTLTLPASNVCTNIPTTAKAYVLNVTLVPNGPLDFVTVYPTGETRPDFWTVRSLDGLVVANSAIVAAGTNGGINVFASNSTNIIIDISGYFTDNPVQSNLVYYPLTPCRVIETRIDYRTTPGPFGPPTMNPRETRPFRFPGNGFCPVPAGAAAYSATITVVPPNPLAYLTAWPEGRPQPNVSSMNSPAGRVLANSVIVPASPDGGINLHTYDRSDVIVDITGYFGPDDGATGLFFFPVRQCRISQTNGTGFNGIFSGPIFENETTRTIPIPTSSCAGVPASAKGYSLNATVMPGGSPMPFLTIYPTGQGQPNASVINAFEGQTVSSGFLVAAGTNGAVNIYAYRRTHVALEISGYFGR